MLIVKDKIGNVSEISELFFESVIVDGRFASKLNEKEMKVLDNINYFKTYGELRFNFCPFDFVEGELTPELFIQDFGLESDISFQPMSNICDRGSRLIFKTLDSYLTANFYFRDWWLFGEWHRVQKAQTLAQ